MCASAGSMSAPACANTGWLIRSTAPSLSTGWSGAEVTELAGATPVDILPGVVIVWDALVGRLALTED